MPKYAKLKPLPKKKKLTPVKEVIIEEPIITEVSDDETEVVEIIDNQYGENEYSTITITEIESDEEDLKGEISAIKISEIESEEKPKCKRGRKKKPETIAKEQAKIEKENNKINKDGKKAKMTKNAKIIFEIEGLEEDQYLVTERIRNFVFTLNNYTDADVEYLKCNTSSHKNVKYIVFGKEIGEKCGTPHLQGYIELHNQMTFKIIHQKLVPKGTWVVRRRSKCSKVASDYCKKGIQSKEEWKSEGWKGPNWSKEADIFEFGTISSPGYAAEVIAAFNNIKNGTSNANKEIANLDSIHLTNQFGRTLFMLENVMGQLKKIPNIKTKTIWLYGQSGLGKSLVTNRIKEIFNKHQEEDFFVWNSEEKYQDGYNKQSLCIFEEFRGNIKYGALLQMLDSYGTYKVPIKNQRSIPFCSKFIIINSALSPEEVYYNLSKYNKGEKANLDEDHEQLFRTLPENDSIDQLKRRIKVIKWPNEFVNITHTNKNNKMYEAIRESIVNEICEYFEPKDEDFFEIYNPTKVNIDRIEKYYNVYKKSIEDC